MTQNENATSNNKNVRNAVTFFNNLNSSCTNNRLSPIISSMSNNFEVNLRFSVVAGSKSSCTSTKFTSDDRIVPGKMSIKPPPPPRKLIPRAKLIKRDQFNNNNSNASGSPDDGKPDLLRTNNRQSKKSTIKSRDDGYDQPQDRLLTPDLEARQIIEDFTKQISPYDTFKIPVDVIDCEFFQQTMQFLPPMHVERAAKKPWKLAGDYRKPTKVREKRR